MMKKFIIFTACLLSAILLVADPAFADSSSVPVQQVSIQANKLDKRAAILRDYLAQYNSPLTSHAQDFIDAANTYRVDWKLLPAISGVESTFGKQIPGGECPNCSYNAWGWGVYGNQALYFKSWRDGIFTVTQGLKQNYLSKGLADPYEINQIYSVSPTWGSRVSFFMQDIDSFSKQYRSGQILAVIDQMFDNPTAGTSAQVKPVTPVTPNPVLSRLVFAP